MNITQIKAEQRHAERLMDVIAYSKDYTSNDLQGILTAIVKTIARDKDLLTFAE